MASVECPSCSKKYKVKDDLKPTAKFRCKKCGHKSAISELMAGAPTLELVPSVDSDDLQLLPSEPIVEREPEPAAGWQPAPAELFDEPPPPEKKALPLPLLVGVPAVVLGVILAVALGGKKQEQPKVSGTPTPAGSSPVKEGIPEAPTPQPKPKPASTDPGAVPELVAPYWPPAPDETRFPYGLADARAGEWALYKVEYKHGRQGAWEDKGERMRYTVVEATPDRVRILASQTRPNKDAHHSVWDVRQGMTRLEALLAERRGMNTHLFPAMKLMSSEGKTMAAPVTVPVHGQDSTYAGERTTLRLGGDMDLPSSRRRPQNYYTAVMLSEERSDAVPVLGRTLLSLNVRWFTFERRHVLVDFGKDGPVPSAIPSPAPAPAPKPAMPPVVTGPSAGVPKPLAKPTPRPGVTPGVKPAGIDSEELAKLEAKVRARAMAWFKLRHVRKIACKDCKSTLKVKCGTCRGKKLATCKNCGGRGYYTPHTGGRLGGGRTHVSRRTCNVCIGRKKVSCKTCNRTGQVLCKCNKDPLTVPGFRALYGRRAFWGFLSKTARKMYDRKQLFPDLGKRRVLGNLIGRQIAIDLVQNVKVEIKKDHAIVTAYVTWAPAWTTRSYRTPRAYATPFTTKWIREKGVFYLATPQDRNPEVLLPK